VKPVVPKSASGSTVQPCDQQADGASTIDSAEVTSIAGARTRLLQRPGDGVIAA
jgi:hypothetical protein